MALAVLVGLAVGTLPGQAVQASTVPLSSEVSGAHAASHLRGVGSSGARSLARAGVEDFEFASFEAEYFLGIDHAGRSTLRTVETIVAVFPEFDQNRGIIRAIPNYYDGVPLATSVTGVVDERGIDVPYTENRVGEFTELALGTDEFVHGRTTYVIEYEQRNVVRAFGDTDADEFYWDVNGTGWAQPFGTVAARVHVDAALTEMLTGHAACYVGVSGSTEQCDIEQADSGSPGEPGEQGDQGDQTGDTSEPAEPAEPAESPDATADTGAAPGTAPGTSTESDALTAAAGAVFVASAEGLGPFETLTVAIGFEPGTFTQVDPVPVPGSPGGPGIPGDPILPVSPAGAWWIDVASYALVGLIVLGTAFTVVWRFVRPASSRGSGIIVPQYTPPKDLNVMEAAELIGRSGFAVSAQIVSFAVRGKLRILDYPVTGSGARYSLQLLSTDGLDAHERALVRALFGGEEPGALREVGVVDDAAASAVSAVSSRVRESVIARGLLVKRSPAVGIAMAVGMFVLSFVTMGVFMLSVFSGHVNVWGIAGFILAMVAIFVCLGFAFRPPVPTEEGVAHTEYLLGIRDYLRLAEADRLRMLQSPEGARRVRAEGLDPRFPAQRVKLYERLLPFAVLWGVERDWSRELTVLYGDSPPDWFVTTGSFDASAFSVALGSIAVASVVSSTPSTSSSWSGSGGGSFSGGSMGGGFSGGGGGGGGGGGR